MGSPTVVTIESTTDNPLTTPQLKMTLPTHTTPDDWFQFKAEQYNISPTDLRTPDTVTPEEAVNMRVLDFSTFDGLYGDYPVIEVGTGGGNDGTQHTYAYYRESLTGKIGVALSLPVESYETDSTKYRFVPSDASFTIPTKQDAVTALREMGGADRISFDRAREIATPWHISDEIQSRWGDSPAADTGFRRGYLCSIIVTLGIDGVDAISADDYYGKSITGHTKSDRGEFKANLTLIEDDAGLSPTFARTRSENVQSGDSGA